MRGRDIASSAKAYAGADLKTSDAVASSDNLRTSLRAVTARAHDMLDRSVRNASGWTRRTDYIGFLTLQHTARAPIEAWLSQNIDEKQRPPAQAHLIAEDLEAFGTPAPDDCPIFELPSNASALGVAWVLAGSALGNRSILREVKRAGGDRWPTAFLADSAMLAFWNRLRERIERPASGSEVSSASRGAMAVFNHFIGTTEAVAAQSARQVTHT